VPLPRWLKDLVGLPGANPGRDAVESARAQFEAAARPLLSVVRSGNRPSESAVLPLGAVFARYYEALAKFHGSRNNLTFAEDRFPFYRNACKLALLAHPDHFAWPFMSAIRKGMCADIEASWATLDDWSVFCAIMPALREGKNDLAWRASQRIAHDAYLVRMNVMWLRFSVENFPEHNDVAAVRRFLASIETAVAR
jgi:hypothetical protein